MLCELDPQPRYRRTKDENRWADHIEILCLQSRDMEISVADLAERWQQSPYGMQETCLGDDRLSDDSHTQGTEHHAQAFDLYEQRIRGYFRYLEAREQAFVEYYPFTVESGSLLKRKKTLTLPHQVYLYLLLAANSEAICESGERNAYRTCFEHFSCIILKAITPATARTEIFGTSKEGSLFQGNLRERMKQLSLFLGTQVRASYLSCRDLDVPGGDAGLDIVSYIPIDDQHSNPLIFAQCACSYEDWYDKQNSISRDIWSKRLENIAPHLELTFIPCQVRAQNMDWDSHDQIRTCVFDRYRLIQTIKKTECLQMLTGHQRISEIFQRLKDSFAA